MELVKKYIPFVCVIAAFVLLLVFRTVPSKKLWDNYTVLYVPVSTGDDLVINALEAAQINDFICLKNQRVPVLLSPFSPEVTMLKLNTNSTSEDYLFSRENFFYDSTGNYKLFYIPSEYKKNLNDCIHFLEKRNIKTGIDVNFSYPWILPLLIMVYFVILFIFAKNKLLFFCLNIFPAIFIFCNPFYAACTSVILIQTSLFIISNIWGRKNAKKQLIKTIAIILLLFVSLLSAFSSSIRSGLFYLIANAGTLSMLFIYDLLKNRRESKMNFVPVYIKPAKMISGFGGNGKIILPVSLGITAVTLVYFALSFTNITPGFSQKIQLPGLSNSSEDKLPSLEDYYKWNWNIVSRPFKSLNKNYSDDSYVVYPSFTNENNKITENDKILSYDDNFRQSVYNDIDSLDFDSIEKVLKSQNKNAKYAYVQTNSYKVSLFSIIMMFISFSVLLFIYFSVIIKKGGKK